MRRVVSRQDAQRKSNGGLFPIGTGHGDVFASKGATRTSEPKTRASREQKAEGLFDNLAEIAAVDPWHFPSAYVHVRSLRDYASR